MPRIILSLILVTGAVTVIAVGATGAFFSDTETSTQNTFASGAIDLKIDNESYYNGELNPNTTWELTDLTIEKFFDFNDVKPADYGEDTISIHVDTNDTYLCADVTLTSNDDNGLTEPEALVDETNGAGEGELAQNITFMWWADDGDNVFENDEQIISIGPIGALALNEPFSLALADSDENIWTGQGGPIEGEQDYYIGKAWCFGEMTPAALEAGDYPDGPTADNNDTGIPGEPGDGGFFCDATGFGNETQTDSLTADVSFQAVQARNNPDFLCEECEVDTETDQVENGSFETPEVDTTQQWNIFDSIAGGWTVEWRDDIPLTFGNQSLPEPAHLELHEGVLGNAFEGDQYAELDTDWGGPTDSGTGEPASVTIYQDILTSPGTKYKLSFAFAPRPNTAVDDNHLEVRWDDAVVYDSGEVAGGGGAIAWSLIEVEVIATSATTRLQFTDLGTANSLGTFLDDISLVGLECGLTL